MLVSELEMRRRIGLIGGLVTAYSKFGGELGCSVSPRTGRNEESSLLQATVGSADRTEIMEMGHLKPRGGDPCEVRLGAGRCGSSIKRRHVQI